MRVPSQDPEVGAIVPTRLPRLTRPSWLGEGTFQGQSQPAEESPIPSSEKSNINSRENAVTGSGHRGEDDRRGTPTRADPWLGEEASQEQPEPVVEPPTPSSQNSNIHSGEKASASSESGHRGGTRVTILAHLPSLTHTPWPREDALQEQPEQPQHVVEPPTPSSQNSETNLGRNAGVSLGHRGGSDRCLPAAYVPPITMRRA